MMTRKDYVTTAAILAYASDKTHPAVFSKMVIDFAEMFAKDNPRFDANRFYSAANYKIPSFKSQKTKGQKMKTENKERIKRVLEIRRSNAATPIPSKKTYTRKRKHKKGK